MKKYILLLFLGLIGTLNAQEININVPVAIQEESTWCGIACSQSVLRYFGPYVRQCTIMEYVRRETLSYGIADCCEDVSQGCNAGGIDLYGSKGSVQAILSYFGTINSVVHPMLFPWKFEIGAYLRNKRPLIISLVNSSNGAGHSVVVHGIDLSNGKDNIYYMDPSDDENLGGLQKETYKKLTTGHQLPYSWRETLIIGDFIYPYHCFNLKCDGDEDGVDCGGSCDPCQAPPPPPNTCANCTKDPGEEQVDCGGASCPPCEDVPEERIITHTNQLRTEVTAFNKITAKDATTVKSGERVCFITEEEGEIILRPGFKVERGAIFTTQRWNDISGYGRICPKKLCLIAQISFYTFHILPPHSGHYYSLRIDDLLYAEKIEYAIYDSQERFIYDNVMDITYNGSIHIWDGKTGAITTQGIVIYYIICTVTYCNGSKYRYFHIFSINNDCHKNKSLTDDTENLAPAHFPGSDNFHIQDGVIAHTLSIIPNPNTGTFQVEANFSLSDIAHFKITNSLGATVYETQNLFSNTIQLQNSASGLHFVVAMLKDGTMLTQKMVIQK